MVQDDPITATTTVREVMTRYPQAEAIFNRHGLTGCGGPRGPIEPIGFFATVHHVDPEVLLRELNEAARNRGVEAEPAAATTAIEQPDIYRIFVKTALVIVITVGCSLGAINLAAMALAGVTGSYWEAITQAHGHAQVFGWVGLFIMGVAYHVLPRLKSTELQGRTAAMASYWLMLSGIVLRMAAQPFAESPSLAGIVVLSALVELVAASLFAYVVIGTLASNPASADFWDKYVIASTLWFWVSATATLAISLYTSQRGLAVIPNALDAPYLHVALMGFVTMMIFGITLRTIPVFMGLRAPDVRTFDVLFWTLNLSVLLKGGSGWLAAFSPNGTLAAAGFAGSVLEYASVVAFVLFLGILGKPERDLSAEGAGQGYEKFVRASYLWLLVAATMTAAYALYQVATGLPVPHSLVGAYRHALTVGFISMIIIGMAARIIPVFTGVRLYSELMLLGTFVLLNLGNGLRVITQPLADLVGGAAFAFMGVSGFIEVTGLALFVYNLWRTIDAPVEEEIPMPTSGTGPSIVSTMVVADVLRRYPPSLDILVKHGFTQLLSPMGRRTLARAVTLEEAARIKGVDLELLLGDLNANCLPGPVTPGAASGEDRAGVRIPTVPKPSNVSRELVTMALRSCYDPEIAVNIVDLGLVYDVRIEGSSVEVEMTLTAPGCPMGNQMLEEVKQTLAELPGVQGVQVRLVFDPPWTPDRMSPEAKRQLGMTVA